MHQGIFLGDEKAINRVYPEAVRAALAKICALKETVYTKAAVLDVTVEEPLPPAHPLCALDNCFLTTHIAGSAGQEVWRMAAYMLGELQRLEAGAPTRYGVTTAMLETMA